MGNKVFASLSGSLFQRVGRACPYSGRPSWTWKIFSGRQPRIQKISGRLKGRFAAARQACRGIGTIDAKLVRVICARCQLAPLRASGELEGKIMQLEQNLARFGGLILCKPRSPLTMLKRRSRSRPCRPRHMRYRRHHLAAGHTDHDERGRSANSAERTQCRREELRSYSAAKSELGISARRGQGLRTNNRAENPHQPVRRREFEM
jgi:hypothetical protein